MAGTLITSTSGERSARLASRITGGFFLFLMLNFDIAAVAAGIRYQEGVPMNSFREGDEIHLKVNKLTSTETLIPLDYYRFPFCQPEGGPKMNSENLGQILAGDRIYSSPYAIKMKKDMYCEQLCIQHLGRAEQPKLTVNKMVRIIRNGYHHNFIVDNLSAASKMEDDTQVTTRYWQGFPVGFIADDNHKAYIHNHINIELYYRRVDDTVDSDPSTSASRSNAPEYRIVRFIVEPFSIQHHFEPLSNYSDYGNERDYLREFARINNPMASCNPNTPYEQRKHTSYDMIWEYSRQAQPASGMVLFTYDVIWTEDYYTTWSSRWDVYLAMNGAVPARVHWVSIINSMFILLLLSLGVAAAWLRTVRRDVARYDKLETNEEAADHQENNDNGGIVQQPGQGFVLVGPDVFRPPSTHPRWLAIGCGAGAQLLFMAFFLIGLAALGIIGPAKRGSFVMAELILFSFFGSINGYVTMRLYKVFEGKDGTKTAILAGLWFPGLVFLFHLFVVFLAWWKQSTLRIPLTTTVVLLVLWLAIQLPMVLAGAYVGWRQEVMEFPMIGYQRSPNSMSRPIPNQPRLLRAPTMPLAGGVLPFGACLVELYYIVSSAWLGYYYYSFGFLLVVFVIVLVTSAEISILFTYFQLRYENHRWWWSAFTNSGTLGVWVFIYSLIYFRQVDAPSIVSRIIYFGSMGLVSLGMFCMMGFVGVVSSLWFNNILFTSIKERLGDDVLCASGEGDGEGEEGLHMMTYHELGDDTTPII